MKNRVKKILNSRGYKRIQLSDDLLEKLKVDTPHRFNKIWKNEVEMTQGEMIAFKNWLGLETIDELFYVEEENLVLEKD